MSDVFSFVLNGRTVEVRGASTHTTLLQWLRQEGYTGSKEGCAEGDCGACTVIVLDRTQRGAPTYRAINSCIAFLPSLAGREVLTVEGYGGGECHPPKTPLEGPALHPVQDAMVRHLGSQCGYCTPGFIASMFEGYYREDLGDGGERTAKIVDQLNGNLCRCTGYRPIRDAMVDALATPKKPDDKHRLKLLEPASGLPKIEYEAGGERFFRPTELSELLRLRTEHPEAQLLGGATELGVFVNKRNMKIPTLIATEGVAELLTIEEHDDHFRVGGAATLTQLEEAIGEQLPLLKKMLWAFASRPIRSRATLAGNLVNASPIGDTPPILLALDATLELASVRGTRTVKIDEFFLDYRKTVLASDEVVTFIRVPKLAQLNAGYTRVADSFKVSKRRELDISIAAVACVIEIDADNVVRHARLAFGGVAATPIRAKDAEAALLGKPWTPEHVEVVAAQLEHTFTPLDDVRSRKQFRSDLCGAFLRKLLRGERSEAQDLPLVFERAGFTPNVDVRTDASRRGSHESAALHVSGRATYVYDEALQRPMLEMWPVLAPCARGTLKSLDLEAARSMPGVVTILTSADVPGDKAIGAIKHDEPLFADDEISYHGQVLAMIVGTSWKACREAAAKVKIEVEEQTPILGCEEAILADSFHTAPHTIARGDAQGAIASAPHRLEGAIDIGGQEHFYLESQAAWAEVDDFGDVFVSSSTQHPSEVQALVSHVLHIPRHRVTVQSPRMGGGFGGKESQGAAWAVYAALAALKTGRAARVQLDRDLDMRITGKRHPFLGLYEVGFDDDGRVLGVIVKLYSDGGYSLDLSESINDRGLFHLDNAYYFPAAHFVGRVCRTNVTSHTAFRGFGGPQGMVVIEEVMDRIARTLGKNPEEVREVNLYHGSGATNTTHYGQEIGDDRIGHIWRTLSQGAELRARRAAIAEWNATHHGIKRGIAITPIKFGISFTASFLNQAGALVLVYRDGSCQVNHGGTEMGQGLYTKVLGVAMRELGLSVDKVRVTKTRTDKVPNTSPTAASSGSDLNGQAVRDACEQIRARLEPIAKELLASKFGGAPSVLRFYEDHVYDAVDSERFVSLEEVCERAYLMQVSMSATGYYRTPGIVYDKAKGRGKPFYYFASGAAVSEVEIDGYTGMKRVRRVDILHDVGDSLNPGVDRGQIEGGFVQGMGWLTGEDLKWNAEGKLLSHSASTYPIPSIGDAPERFHVELLRAATQPGVIHGSKAVGEPPLMLAISVREAIRDAIAAFGAPGGEVPLPCPATHEAIFACVKARGHE